VNANIVALLKEEIDNDAKPFGKYEEAKARIMTDIKIDSKEKKRKKIIEYLEEKLGTQGMGKEPLQLTQGLREDKEEGSSDEEGEEEVKGKALVVVTPPRNKAKRTTKKLVVTPFSPLPPTKPRTRAITSVEQYA
jgi:hypothetical protein